MTTWKEKQGLERTALIIGRFTPNQGAAGVRVSSIANMLLRLGYKTVFLSNTKSDTTRLVNGFACEQVFFRKKEKQAVCNIFDIVTGAFEYSSFKRCVSRYSPQLVILYNELYASSKSIIAYCKKHGITVFADVTEWYTLTPLRFGIADWLFTRSVDMRIRKLDKRLDGIIVISRYFQDYYKALKIPVLLVPPIMVNAMAGMQMQSIWDQKTISIIYAGSPGTKDLLSTVADAVERINISRQNVVFHVYGITEQQMQILWKQGDLAAAGIVCHGMVSREEVLLAVRQANFSVLLRKNERYAKAGYSSKFAESLSLGTPVICNSIGGTDLDLVDGTTGILLPNADAKTIYATLRSLFDLDAQTYYAMRKNAYAFAQKHYCGETYLNSLRRLIIDESKAEKQCCKGRVFRR